MRRLIPVMIAVSVGGCALFTPAKEQPTTTGVNPALYGDTARGASHLAPIGTTVGPAMGFASLTGELRGHCIERVHTRPSGADMDELEVSYAEDASSLSKSLGVSASASAEFGLASVSAEAEFVTESARSGNSSFLVVHAVSLAPVDALVRYRLTDDALAALRDDTQRFYRRCGDQFVAAVQRGATFNAIAQIESASTAQRDYLRAHARASYLGLGGGGGFDHEVKETMGRLRARFYVIQTGTRGAEIPAFDDFVNRARHLNQGLADVRDAGNVVRFETKPYDVAENWPTGITLPALHEQARTLELLASWHRSFSMTLAELDQAREAPRNPPCPDGPALFQRQIGNFSVAKRRVEERAHECVNQPMQACNTDGLAQPAASTPAVIDRCSDIAAHVAAAQRRQRRQEQRDHRRVAVEAKQQEEARRVARACRGHVESGCDPCVVWEFRSLTFDAPRRKLSGSFWDVGGGLPDPVIVISSGGTSRDARSQDSYSVSREFEPPIRLESGREVSVSVVDQDLSEHDRMMKLRERVPDRIPHGVWRLGAGALELAGSCAE